MKNIHILPTDKSSRLSIKDGVLILHRLQWRKGTQHIYITSDKEIKEGVNEWYLDKFINKPRNSSGSQYSEKQDVIILTSDQDLIEYGVQAIDDDFLEWFVKNQSCEEVEVRSFIDAFEWRTIYKIIIPKEEPKQETLEEELLQQIKFCLICKNDSQAIRLIEKYGFQKQEQMYSEEEVLDILFSISVDNPNNITKWFKQFKKK